MKNRQWFTKWWGGAIIIIFVVIPLALLIMAPSLSKTQELQENSRRSAEQSREINKQLSEKIKEIDVRSKK
ncbi:MAG: hypothetical protein AAB895_00165 [Patescibacteria group bacterium]